MTQTTAKVIVMRQSTTTLISILTTSLAVFLSTSCTPPPQTQVRVQAEIVENGKSGELPSVVMRFNAPAKISIVSDSYTGKLYDNIEADYIASKSKPAITFKGKFTDLTNGNHASFGPFLIDGKAHKVNLNKKQFNVRADLIYANGSLVNKN